MKLDESLEDANLIILSVHAPDKTEDKEGEGKDNKEKEDEAIVVLLGVVKEIDMHLGGPIRILMSENAKTFKNGAKLGSSLSILRVVQNDKVRNHI